MAETPIYKTLREDLEKLSKKVEVLEMIIRKMAHFSGNSRILIEYGIEKWIPGEKDMKKFYGR